MPRAPGGALPVCSYQLLPIRLPSPFPGPWLWAEFGVQGGCHTISVLAASQGGEGYAWQEGAPHSPAPCSPCASTAQPPPACDPLPLHFTLVLAQESFALPAGPATPEPHCLFLAAFPRGPGSGHSSTLPSSGDCTLGLPHPNAPSWEHPPSSGSAADHLAGLGTHCPLLSASGTACWALAIHHHTHTHTQSTGLGSMMVGEV